MVLRQIGQKLYRQIFFDVYLRKGGVVGVLQHSCNVAVAKPCSCVFNLFVGAHSVVVRFDEKGGEICADKGVGHVYFNAVFVSFGIAVFIEFLVPVPDGSEKYRARNRRRVFACATDCACSAFVRMSGNEKSDVRIIFKRLFGLCVYRVRVAYAAVRRDACRRKERT